LVDDENERVLARHLADLLPVRGLVQGMVLPLPGMSPSQNRVEQIRTFEDTDGVWKASVAPDFLALETTRYSRRADFLHRLRPVLDALNEVVTPPRVTRIGMRYTDRITDPEGLTSLANTALLGMLAEIEHAEWVENQVLQTLLVDSGTGTKVQVRSLCLPPHVGFDPSIEPVGVRSWVLDIDAFEEKPRRWESSVLVDAVEVLAKRSYQVFHWAVTDEFRARYAASPQGKAAHD
jgi:uncharacterized protein (TIGR04255 family)